MKIKMGEGFKDRPAGIYAGVLVGTDEYAKTIGKQWHLTSTQLGVLLGVSGGFWLIVGIAVATRVLLVWGCVGTWR